VNHGAIMNKRFDFPEKHEPELAHIFLFRCLAACLILLLAAQGAIPGAAQEAMPASQREQASARPQSALPDSPAPAMPDHDAAIQNQPPEAVQAPTQNSKPVGTAVAPYEKPAGVAGSRAEGAVIAPGKQKRVHSFVIKFGLIAGAAAAGGAVIALSMGSRSRPQ
jgi:hypothetical protein